MASIEDQLAWEAEMTSLGINRFRNNEMRNMEKATYERTNAGSRLLKGYLESVSEFMAHYLAGNGPEGRRRNKWARMLEAVEPDKLAMFTMSCVVHSIYADVDLATLYRKLGRMIEDELRFTHFAIEMPEYFTEIMEDLNRKRTTNYTHRHKVLVHSMNKKGVVWRNWSDLALYNVGALALSLALECTDLMHLKTVTMSRNRRKTYLVPSEELTNWIAKSDSEVEQMFPDRLPCIVQPEDWTDPNCGGYYTREMGMTQSLVKVRRGKAGKQQMHLLRKAEMPTVYKAVNAMQHTQWEINEEVLEVMQEVWRTNLGLGMPSSEPYVIPPAPIAKGQKSFELEGKEKGQFDDWKSEARELYGMERERKAHVLGVARTMRLAEMLRVKPLLHFVYTLDFRGRVYASTSGVSPQGADHAKAVLRFKRGRRVGETGAYWLKVHGANKYGYDKASYDDRVAWIDSRREEWLAIANDPLTHRGWASSDVDKPYQFLAWCFEYADLCKQGPNFVSHLAVALDGSCNGLQHFSAMLRDPVGGKAVNLIPGTKPADIYQDVADVATRKLRAVASTGTEEAELARNWLGFLSSEGYDALPRKATKPPVMTLPYGSTMNACTKTTYAWYKGHNSKYFEKHTNFKQAVFLAKIIWDSIAEVVVAARQAMRWIQDCSSVLSASKKALRYTTPIGFPVLQATCKIELRDVSAKIGGNQFRVKIARDLPDLDARKQRQGSSPNLVHAIDATHMMMCLSRGEDEGIQDFAMIHDDFGVHACEVPKWHKIIREEFVRLHSRDVLQDFKDEHDRRTGLTLPDPPDKGSLELPSVLSSAYFFG